MSESYIKQRARFAGLSSETDPEESNLTRTGDMLDSLFSKVDVNGLTVNVKGDRNALKAMYTSIDRPWANLSYEDIEFLKQVVRDSLQK